MINELECGISKDGKRYLAHCLRLGLMASAYTAEEAVDRLKKIIVVNIMERVLGCGRPPKPDKRSKQFTIRVDVEVVEDLS